MRRNSLRTAVPSLNVSAPRETPQAVIAKDFNPAVVFCRCGWPEVRRSKSHWYEWPLNLALMAFRCDRCRLRFWRMRWRAAPFVWLDASVDILDSALIRNPVFWIFLLIIFAAATGAGLGYLLSELSRSEAIF